MKKKKTNIFAIILCAIFLFLAALAFLSIHWYFTVYGDIGFDSIVFTLLSPMNGVEQGILVSFLTRVLLPTILFTAIVLLFLFLPIKRRVYARVKGEYKLKIYPFTKRVAVRCSVLLSVVILGCAVLRANLINYIIYTFASDSPLYDNYYADPDQVQITFPEQKQNLIYIYLESMETTFLSKELGGGNNVNPIQELYNLAENNINFSHNSSVGGFSSLAGSTWTIGAMVSTSAGIPLKTPFNVEGNNYGQNSFLPGVTTLSDILHQNGYYQALMVGSESEFGGRKQYYEQHHTDKIYDLATARKDGIVPKDYYVWWGMEDLHLYKYAKQELTELAKEDQPFAFTMLTVDSHHVNGYKCKLCADTYSEQYENVLSCASKQLVAFVQWIQAQDFYENTTIVISGDHPTMDGEYIARNIPKGFDRKVYNCFINAKAEAVNAKNRDFSAYDMFPTTLAALGCEIEGNRLGLGTNLFSEVSTLCEEMGRAEFAIELTKKSSYYNNNFYKSKK